MERYTLFVLVKQLAGLIGPEFPTVETERLTCNLEKKELIVGTLRRAHAIFFSQTAEALAVRIHCETGSPAPPRKCRQNNPTMRGPGSIEHLTLRAQPITSYLTDSERSCHERPDSQIATAAISTDHSASLCHWSGRAIDSIQQNWLQTTSSSSHADPS